MMKTIRLKIATGLLVLLSSFILQPAACAGTVPSIMNYQGRLTDNHGNPLAGGYYRIEFRVWAHPLNSGAGDLIWGREFPAHIMTGGVFNILLSDDGGTLTPAPTVANLRDAFAGQDRYLGLTITQTPGGAVPSPSEISPRQRLVSAPFAFCAEDAHKAPDGFKVTGILQAGPGGAWISGGVSVSNGNIALRGNWITRDGAGTGLTVDSAGNVGIGTNAPAAALHVASGRIRDKTGLVMPPGAVLSYAGAAAPAGWLACDGSAVSRATYADLFTAIGVAYGSGDGSTTFNLPDLRGRAPIGAGQGTGLSLRARGDKTGSETHPLTVSEIPAHNHGSIRVASRQNYGYVARSGPDDGVNQGTSYYSTDTTGGNQPHNNMPPSLALNYIIKY